MFTWREHFGSLHYKLLMTGAVAAKLFEGRKPKFLAVSARNLEIVAMSIQRTEGKHPGTGQTNKN